jgi:hypothetical protein
VFQGSEYNNLVEMANLNCVKIVQLWNILIVNDGLGLGVIYLPKSIKKRF